MCSVSWFHINLSFAQLGGEEVVAVFAFHFYDPPWLNLFAHFHVLVARAIIGSVEEKYPRHPTLLGAYLRAVDVNHCPRAFDAGRLFAHGITAGTKEQRDCYEQDNLFHVVPPVG